MDNVWPSCDLPRVRNRVSSVLKLRTITTTTWQPSIELFRRCYCLQRRFYTALIYELHNIKVLFHSTIIRTSYFCSAIFNKKNNTLLILRPMIKQWRQFNFLCFYFAKIIVKDSNARYKLNKVFSLSQSLMVFSLLRKE